jgi:hypothetical protein
LRLDAAPPPLRQSLGARVLDLMIESLGQAHCVAPLGNHVRCQSLFRLSIGTAPKRSG